MTRKRIWIPEHSATPPIQHTEIRAGFRCSIGGIFKVELIEAATGRVKQYLEFPNLITDAGLDAIVGTVDDQNALFDFLGVGTDSTVPTVSDTTLGSEVDRTDSSEGFDTEETVGYVTGSDDFDGPYHFKRFVRVFVEADGNGNLTELAWFRDAAGSTMVVRSLFKDGGGTPVTVTKTSADQLKVTYEMRLYPPIGETPEQLRTGGFSLVDSGTVILGTTTHSWTSSALNTDSINSWGHIIAGGQGALRSTLSAFNGTAVPSGTDLINVTGSQSDFSAGPVLNSSFDTDAYVAGTFERTGVSTWEPAAANFGPGGIAGFTMQVTNAAGTEQQFQMVVSESIVKTGVERLRIKWRFVLDRAET